MSLFSHRNQSLRSSRSIRTVLIVEDEPIVAFENEHALAHAGYRVVRTVDRYAHAVEAMAETPVDLVVADIGLAGVHSGIDVARHAATLGIPVLFSSGSLPAEARELGVGWIAKPYLPRDLVRAIGVVDLLRGGKVPGVMPGGMTLLASAA